MFRNYIGYQMFDDEKNVVIKNYVYVPTARTTWRLKSLNFIYGMKE